MSDAYTFNSTNNGLTLVDKNDSSIHNVRVDTRAPPELQVFDIISAGSNQNKTAGIVTKMKADALTFSSVLTVPVIAPLAFNSREMNEYFAPPKVLGIREVQLRESYAKGDSNTPDHHWLTINFLDSSGDPVATSGIILGSQSYKFSQTERVAIGDVSTIKSLLNLSTSQTKAAKDAFFDSLENIILENNSLSQLIRLPASVSREGSEKLILREAAFVIEEPIPLDLSLIEPPEIV